MSEYPAEFNRNPMYSMTVKQIAKQAIADFKEDWARKTARKNAQKITK